jgi:hypothetical protein
LDIAASLALLAMTAVQVSPINIASTDGEPWIDVRAIDIARFDDYALPDYGTIKSSENCARRFRHRSGYFINRTSKRPYN